MFFADNEEADAEEFKHGATFHETTLCRENINACPSNWSAFLTTVLFVVYIQTAVSACHNFHGFPWSIATPTS